MQFNDWLLFIRGTFPNFLGAIGYCTIFFVYFRAYLIKKGKYNFYTALFGAFIFSFGGLCLWELCQLLPFFTFDIFDILMTFAGSVLSSILIIFLYRKQNTK
jgi:glycopeptide antibiotics resistance protein